MTKYFSKTFEQSVYPKGSKRCWAGRSNDKHEVVKYWIQAQEYVEAILETHAIFKHEQDNSGSVIWASQGYDAIWMSG